VLGGNVFGLCTVAEFGVQNCQTTNSIHKKSPALESFYFQELGAGILFAYSILNELFQVFSE
jgi:hypothetical protein